MKARDCEHESKRKTESECVSARQRAGATAREESKQGRAKDRQTDGQTDRQTDKQKESECYGISIIRL